ncbi:helix-turn-helix domain-containing protein [Allokutzneria oryzae]|uniref:Helix-turn-helix domain-containing protein n=1 Tax=Allokutzneria oryzae TaxID=1378989 RepID=A0ABV5ZXR2_9PSEU
MTDPRPEGDRSLAVKVDHLFRTIRPRDGGEFSFEEVADAIRAGGVTISATYLWQLRRGVRDNPTKRHLEALAGFFGVPVAYFFDDGVAERIDAELALLSALRDSSVRQLALRASGLSPKSLNAISEMVNRVREIEGLPEPTSADD